jgi:hypothetical protein
MTFEQAKQAVIQCSGSGKPLKIGFADEGLPCAKEKYLAKDWEMYMPDNLKGVQYDTS